MFVPAMPASTVCVCSYRYCHSVCVFSASSLAQLISANADYLVNCVALTLRTHKQEALQVLQAVMKHG